MDPSRLSTLRSDLRSYIRENFLIREGELPGDEDSLLDGGILDSTGVLELITHLEDSYGIEVLDEEIVPANLDSIAALAAYLERKGVDAGDSSSGG